MIPLNLLGISGSPRAGNSDFLLEQAMAAAVSIAPGHITPETWSFRGKHFEPCLGCNHCVRNQGACVHRDDFEELRGKWMEADVILYSLPVYHMSMPGQVKCFIDRLGNSSFGSHRVMLPDGTETLMKQCKVIGTIAQGIHFASGQEHTITDMINHALIMQSVPVTGDMWETYIGAGGWTKNRGERDAMKRLAEEGDLAAQAAVKAARSLGRRAVETATVLLSGLIACRDTLIGDPLYGCIYRRLEAKS